MHQEVQDDIDSRRSIPRYNRPGDRHALSVEMWQTYMKQLEVDGNMEPLPPSTYKLLEEIYKRKKENIRTFRDYNYAVDHDSFIVLKTP